MALLCLLQPVLAFSNKVQVDLVVVKIVVETMLRF